MTMATGLASHKATRKPPIFVLVKSLSSSAAFTAP
jgi:hypothetical protein